MSNTTPRDVKGDFQTRRVSPDAYLVLCNRELWNQCQTDAIPNAVW